MVKIRDARGDNSQSCASYGDRTLCVVAGDTRLVCVCTVSCTQKKKREKNEGKHSSDQSGHLQKNKKYKLCT